MRTFSAQNKKRKKEKCALKKRKKQNLLEYVRIQNSVNFPELTTLKINQILNAYTTQHFPTFFLFFFWWKVGRIQDGDWLSLDYQTVVSHDSKTGTHCARVNGVKCLSLRIF